MAETFNTKRVNAYDNFPFSSLNNDIELLGDAGSLVGNVTLGQIVSYVLANATYFSNVFNNTSAGTITTYPTVPGLYRIGNVSVPGTPSTSSLYAALAIFNCGQYLIHLLVDANNVAYAAFTSAASGVFIPTSWSNISDPYVSLMGTHSITDMAYSTTPTLTSVNYANANGGVNPFLTGTVPTVSLSAVYQTSVPHQRIINLINPTYDSFSIQAANLYPTGTWSATIRWQSTGKRAPVPSRA